MNNKKIQTKVDPERITFRFRQEKKILTHNDLDVFENNECIPSQR